MSVFASRESRGTTAAGVLCLQSLHPGASPRASTAASTEPRRRVASAPAVSASSSRATSVLTDSGGGRAAPAPADSASSSRATSILTDTGDRRAALAPAARPLPTRSARLLRWRGPDGPLRLDPPAQPGVAVLALLNGMWWWRPFPLQIMWRGT